ncbi:MAG TPA: precorrin-8X methylmutase [Devosia sp.]|nr:precorrin-8X methylmutase [Devosia sp.]
MIGDYIRDPEEIYAQSFAIIRAEADLSGVPPELEEIVVRMVHACGMVDIVPEIRWGGEVAAQVEFALLEGAAILCDSEMVKAGISHKYLPQHVELVATINDPAVPALAEKLGTTRAAAGVELWQPRLKGAVVVIGNAPTALFHLLELLDRGADRPAAIIATPVGFVGAEESKAQLALDLHRVPFLTLLGRRGGSAIASAAVNAIARNMEENIKP